MSSSCDYFFPEGSRDQCCDGRARQWAKIREITESLRLAGFQSLDEQAEAIGLSRSTTWSILKGLHKNSGLSTTTIFRVLITRDFQLRCALSFWNMSRKKRAASMEIVQGESNNSRRGGQDSLLRRVKLFTRNGHDWSGRFPLITEAALRNRCSSARNWKRSADGFSKTACWTAQVRAIETRARGSCKV